MHDSHDAVDRGIFGDMVSLLEHLPHYQESETLVILKGHLLIEEMLRGYIDRKLPNPSAFKHEHFSFPLVLTLSRSLTPTTVKTWAFDAAKKLNELRNEVAHELSASGLQKKFGKFVSLVEQHNTNSVFPPKERGDARLYMAISDLHKEFVRILYG